jgi:hypothetical protein
MTDVERTTHVVYEHPGSLFPENSGGVVDSRDPARAAANASPTAFAFTFHDRYRTTAIIDGERIELRSASMHFSKRYVIGGELLDEAAVEALPGDHKILLSNMRGNGWQQVIRHRTGNFQPFDSNHDEIVEEPRP